MNQVDSTFSSFLTQEQIKLLRLNALEFNLHIIKENEDTTEYVERSKGHTLLVDGNRIDASCSDGTLAITWVGGILKKLNQL